MASNRLMGTMPSLCLRLCSWFVLSLTLSISSVAQAEEFGQTRIVGYGTVGYSLLANHETPEGVDMPNGDSFGGATTKGTFRNLTRFGLNITHTADENTSLVLQLAANGSDLFHGTDEDHQFRVRANLAGLKLNFDLLEFLAGIIPSGYFLISDTMQIGATYLWAQPPKMFYRIGDSSNVVGGRVRKSLEWDESLLTFEFMFGEMLYHKWYDSKSEIDSRSSYLYSLAAEYETEDHNFRMTLSAIPEMNYRRYDYAPTVLQPGQPPVIMKGYGGCRDTEVSALNISYDGFLTDSLRLQSEYALRQTNFDGCFGTQEYAQKMKFTEDAGYVAFGYVIGKWTPRLMLLKQRNAVDLDEAAEAAADRLPTLPRPVVIAQYKDTVGKRAKEKTDTFGVGLNYQWTDYIVVKTELAHYIAPDKNIRGYQLPPDSNATVFNFAVDYVF